jgi:hypothetical protein
MTPLSGNTAQGKATFMANKNQTTTERGGELTAQPLTVPVVLGPDNTSDWLRLWNRQVPICLQRICE